MKIVFLVFLCVLSLAAQQPIQSLLISYPSYVPLTVDFTGASVPGSVTFTRASSGTYNNSSNVLSTATTNTARFNYNSSGTLLGLLYEPAATNILLNSNAFTTGGWFPTNSATITPTAVTSPDGTVDGWTLSSGTGFGSIAVFITLSNVAYTLSCWGQSNTGTPSNVLWIGSNNNGGINTTASWVRRAYSNTPVAGSTEIQTQVNNSAGVVMNLFGCQLETGAVATSYIVTGGTSVTRATDSAVVTMPSGTGHATFTFDDNSTQTVSASAGSYTFPTNLTRPNIKKMVSAP